MFSASITDYNFIIKNNIKLIAISSKDLINNKSKYEELIKKNVFIFVYSSNNKTFIQEHIDISVTGFYTDFWNFNDNICENEICVTY